MGVRLRAWQQSDVDVIVPMLLDCLRVNADAGADLAPTQHNAETFAALGVRWSAEGEPSLVAVDEQGEVAGFTLWGGMPCPWEFVAPLCHGICTYVRADVRRTGVASALRERALMVAKRRGYAKVTGVAFHAEGKASALANGFTVVGEQVEARL